MASRAFPVLYANDVDRVARFYLQLGFVETVRMPSPDGSPGFIHLSRGGAELGVTSMQTPVVLAGIQPRSGPRHELFIYVDDVDATYPAVEIAGGAGIKPPADMPWGERIAYVSDPEGNVVVLAAASTTS